MFMKALTPMLLLESLCDDHARCTRTFPRAGSQSRAAILDIMDFLDVFVAWVTEMLLESHSCALPCIGQLSGDGHEPRVPKAFGKHPFWLWKFQCLRLSKRSNPDRDQKTKCPVSCCFSLHALVLSLYRKVNGS